MRYFLLFVLFLPFVKCASMQKCKTIDIELHNGTGERTIGYKGQMGRDSKPGCMKINFKTPPGLELKHFTIKTSRGVVRCSSTGGKNAECSIDTDKKGRAIPAAIVGAVKFVTMVITGISEGLAIIDWFADSDSGAGSLHEGKFIPFYVLLSLLAMYVTKNLG